MATKDIEAKLILNTDDIQHQTERVANSLWQLNYSLEKLKDYGVDVDMKVKVNSKNLGKGINIVME